ncbi:MAG: hypothetical protein EXS10_02665 [Phycisphaerales bacterium]|nr:hypothetical protein [Phycisphaerales bacterium]
MTSFLPSDPILASAYLAAGLHDGFGSVESHANCVRATAKHSSAPAAFELERRGTEYWVRMLTSDRWLSESIEGDVLEGDPLDELLEEELTELGWRGKVGALKHFRDAQKVYVFEHRVPDASPLPMQETAALFLIAYSKTFHELGDMNSGAGDA